MKIGVTQFYIKPGIKFPFSHDMQGWLTSELSALGAKGSDYVRDKYGEDFDVTVTISAYTETAENVIKGPGVYRKYRELYYTIFLPYDAIVESSDSRRAAAGFLLDGIRAVFQKAGLDVSQLDQKKDSFVEHLCSEPTMLKAPWPS